MIEMFHKIYFTSLAEAHGILQIKVN